MTDFKPLSKRVRNNIVYLIDIVNTNLNELKAYFIIVIKLTSKLNMLLTAPKGSKTLIYN